MEKISNDNMEQIRGGFSAWIALGIASALIYLSGVFEGIVHPRGCNE